MSKNEQDINNILKYHEKELQTIKRPDISEIETSISDSEKLLTEMGYKLNNNIKQKSKQKHKQTIIVPSWKEMCLEAQKAVCKDVEINELFTKKELQDNELAIKLMSEEYNSIHKLDNIDLTICILAGLLAAIVDILLVGIPKKTNTGIKAGKLSDYVRQWFEKEFPKVKMEELANSKISKVSFDAQDNRYTTQYVDGLSAYYHRLLSLGHDPFLGLIFGVLDILSGRMTTIDKKGKMVSQVMENYTDRKESDIFKAIAKQILHFKSDLTTSMGLPAPFMSLFNLFQFGNVGESEQTIAEIVQGMYFEGYDFIQFCASSIPTMLIEVIVRLSYAFKKIKNGSLIKDSIPFSLDREKNPKLSTMLFISHAITSSINAGKVFFKENPMAINYAEWITFAKYSYIQLKWAIFQKPKLKEAYIKGQIQDELNTVYDEINKTYNKCLDDYNIIFN